MGKILDLLISPAQGHGSCPLPIWLLNNAMLEIFVDPLWRCQTKPGSGVVVILLCHLSEIEIQPYEKVKHRI